MKHTDSKHINSGNTAGEQSSREKNTLRLLIDDRAREHLSHSLWQYSYSSRVGKQLTTVLRQRGGSTVTP